MLERRQGYLLPFLLPPFLRPPMQSPAFFPKSKNFSISGGSFSNVQGDQHNHTTYRLRLPNSGNAIDATESASFIQESSTSTTTVYHVQGNQYNHVIQRDKIERTEFDDVSGRFCVCEDHLAESLRLHLVPEP